MTRLGPWATRSIRTPGSRRSSRSSTSRRRRPWAGSGAPLPTCAAMPHSWRTRRRDYLARQPGRDVPAVDHDRCRGLDPGLRARLSTFSAPASGSWPATGERCPGSWPACGSGARTGSGPWSSPTALQAPRPRPSPASWSTPCSTPSPPWPRVGPVRAHPDFDGILGSWWTEGEEIVFEVRDNAAVVADVRRAAHRGHTVRQRWTVIASARAGGERGELLEITRGPGGDVMRMHFATYALTVTRPRSPTCSTERPARSTRLNASALLGLDPHA
jgi:hypothetical protein